MKVRSQERNSPLRLLFIGFGNVAQSVASILFEERDRYKNLKELEVQTVGVIGRSKGTAVCEHGLKMPDLLSRIRDRGSIGSAHINPIELDPLEAVGTLDYDVLVELSTLSVQRQGEPAVSYIRSALERGKHVVTANKGPVAYAFRELDVLAREKGVFFLFEGTVMDGAPVLGLARENLRGCVIRRISGILNSTTNYILTRMERGDSFEYALERARKGGFTEADPSIDIDGLDAAVKTAVLANVLMDAGITPSDVYVEGIRGLSADSVRSCYERGKCLKMLASASRDEAGTIKAQVILEEIPRQHLYAAVSGTGSVLCVETDLMTPLYIVQESPGLYDTAYGVIGDLMRIWEAKK